MWSLVSMVRNVPLGVALCMPSVAASKAAKEAGVQVTSAPGLVFASENGMAEREGRSRDEAAGYKLASMRKHQKGGRAGVLVNSSQPPWPWIS